MARRRSNFVSGTLTGAIDSDDTTISSSGLTALTAVTGSDTAVLILDPLEEFGDPEIVVVTAHTAASADVTVTRGQEGTTARSHGAGTLLIHAPIGSDFTGIQDQVDAVIATPGTTTATGTPGSVTIGAAAAAGSSSAVSKADHVHSVADGAPVAVVEGDAQSSGVATTFARSDHRHARTAFETDTASIGAVENVVVGTGPTVNGAVGASSKPARADHTHRIPSLGVITGMLNDLAVTTAKIAASAVTTAKIAASAVTYDKIATLTGAVSSTSLPTADNHLTNRQWVVTSVADNAALAAVASPTTGQRAYVEDTGTLVVYDGSAWQPCGYSKGADSWVAFTPVWTGLTVGTGGAARNAGRYRILDGNVQWQVNVTLGTTGGAVSGAIELATPGSVTLDLGPASEFWNMSHWVAEDTSDSQRRYPGVGIGAASNDLVTRISGAQTSDITGVPLGWQSGAPFSWAAGDRLTGHGWAVLA